MLVADVATLLRTGHPVSKEAGGGTAEKKMFTISNVGVAATSAWAATATSAASTDALGACTIVAATAVRAELTAAGLLYLSTKETPNNGADALIDVGAPSPSCTNATTALSGALSWLPGIAAAPLVAQTVV